MHKISKNTIGFICLFLQQTMPLQAQYDVLFSPTPESYPGANDGKITATIPDMSQNPPPYTFRIVEEGQENPIEILNNTGVATFTGLGYRNYCITVIMGNNCFAYGCFHFDEPCSPLDGCLAADFDFDFTSDACAVQFLDWSQGSPEEWTWDFGDGASSEEQNPTHIYAEAGCYNVTLKVTKGTLAREFSNVICVTSCNSGNNPAPECQINAPSFAAAGQTINLSAIGNGIAPFEYLWTVPNSINPSGFNDPSITAMIPENADNGDQFNFSILLTDKNELQTNCYHTVTVGGNPPDLEVAAFGSFEAMKPLVLVAFVDVFNITGLEEYYFTLTPLGSQVIDPDGTCLNTWLNGDWDCTLLENVVPEGFYQLCVKVRDDAGVYEDCLDLVIGDPSPLPAQPAMSLVVLSPNNPKTDAETGHLIVEEGDPIKIGITGSHPKLNPNCNGSDHYVIILHYENITLNVSETQGSIWTVPNNNGICEGVPGSGFFKTKLNAPDVPISVNCNNPVFSTGTVKITSEIYHACDNGQFMCDNVYITTRPLYVDLYPGKPVISGISVDNDKCEQPIKVSFASNCGITSYEWHAFNPATNEEIEDFFSGNTNAATVYPDLANEVYLQCLPGGVFRVRCQVTVVDSKGFTSEHTELLIMRIPLRVDLPSVIYRCPGAVSNFSETPIAVGGTNIYTYEWSVVQPLGGDLAFQSNDPLDKNPLFTAPMSGSKQYHLRLNSKGYYGEPSCQVEKDITVEVSNILLDLPDIVWPICSTGGREVGPLEPTNLGGSGQYDFLWSSADDPDLLHLSGKTVSNPVISGISPGSNFTYTLTATDKFGGCTSSDQIAVTGVENNHTVEIHGNGTTCYGQEIMLSSVASPIDNTPPFGNIFNQYHWSTTNPHHDISGIGHYVSQLPIDEIVASYPGNYTYTLKYHNIITGCYAEASKAVTIRPSWKHVGFVPSIKSTIKDASVPLWEGDYNHILSGIGNEGATIKWYPKDPLSTELGSFGVPKNGLFQPTTDTPFLTMEVTSNATGCKKTFNTVRYVITEAQPEIWITPSNTYQCVGGNICFDVVFDAHLPNYQTPLIPEKFPLSITLHAPFNSPQHPDQKDLTIDLKLINSSGLYKGSICEEDFFKYTGKYKLSCSTGNFDDFGYISIDQFVEISPSYGAPSAVVKCLPMGNSTVDRAVKFDFGLQCSGNLISNDGGANAITMASEYIEFHAESGIEIVPSSVIGNNMGRRFVINPCIESQLVDDPPETSQAPQGLIEYRMDTTLVVDIKEAHLDVFPNPFGSEIMIRYLIPEDCAGKMKLTLLDITGKAIEIIQQMEYCPMGEHQLKYDASKLAPGLYFYELQTCKKQRYVKRAIKIGF